MASHEEPKRGTRITKILVGSIWPISKSDGSRVAGFRCLEHKYIGGTGLDNTAIGFEGCYCHFPLGRLRGSNVGDHHADGAESLRRCAKHELRAVKSRGIAANLKWFWLDNLPQMENLRLGPIWGEYLLETSNRDILIAILGSNFATHSKLIGRGEDVTLLAKGVDV